MRGFVAELSDGQIFREEEKSWINLKDYLSKNKHLRIAKLHLEFDHQNIYLPNYSRAYFYAKKVEAYLGDGREPRQYYGIGASTLDPEEVVITWYDGKDSKEEKRKVNRDYPSFICHEVQ